MRTAQLTELAAPAGLVGGPFGSSLVSADYVESGVPVIRGENLNAGKWIGGAFARVSERKVSADLARNTAHAGDVIFTQRGTLGQVALVPAGLADRLVVSQSQMRLRPDPAKALAEFVYYAASTTAFLQQINDRAIATGVPHINLGILGSLEIPVPPLPTQRAIAEVLGALDDKIAANAAVVTACDELRRSKYDAILGSDQVSLSSLARFVNGRAYTKGATGSGRVVIRIAELNSGIGGSTVFNDIEVPEENLAREGDLLFAWSGSLTVARWYRPEAIVNQHIFKVVPNAGWPMWLVACATERKLEDFQAIAADKATTMGHIQRHHLDQLVGVPARQSITVNDPEMQALWDRALVAEVESLRLAELRDTLLPHLMSGRLTVREAEKQVEEVL